MKKKEKQFSLESLSFIFRHPWAFMAAVVLVLNLVGVYLGYLKLNYQVKAIIALETTSGGVVDPKFIQTKHSLIKDMIVGDSAIRTLVGILHPDLQEKSPREYEFLVSVLRNPRTGIRIVPERGSSQDSQLVSISFASRDPKFSYAVVCAALEAVERISKEKTYDKIRMGSAFLKKQLYFYAGKLTKIEEYMSQLKSQIRRIYPTLTSEEKNLVDKNLSVLNMTVLGLGEGASGSAYSSKGEKDESEKADHLMRMNKRKKLIEGALAEGEPGVLFLARRDAEEDEQVQQYEKKISDKEAMKSEFLSQGCLPEHPYVAMLNRDIKVLADLKDERVQGLTDTEKAKQRYEEEINELNASISMLNYENRIMGEDKKKEDATTPSGTSSVSAQENDVSLILARLNELKTEKEVAQHYFNEFRGQLEVADLKGRMETEKSGVEMRVIEKPKLPQAPVRADKLRIIVLGLLMAVAAGSGFSYLLDMMDNSVWTAGELRHILEVPVLGAVETIMMPEDRSMLKFRRWAGLAAMLIFTLVIQIAGAKVLIPLYNGVFGL
jgi:capsular polysaccharide biosynthesis protein/molybdenum-dependent DNA-binding transcriptional regulator ModE